MINKDFRTNSDVVAIKPGRSATSHSYKIALYGFGSQPAVYRHLIELAAKEKLPLAWSAILTAPNYRPVIGEVLPAGEILDVFRALPQVPVGGDLACLAHYSGSLVEDLAAQKRRRRKRSGRWILDRGIDYYKLYKKFLNDRGVTHLFMPLVETPEAKIALAAARELGIGVIVPVDLRNMTGTYFSADCYETPPAYAMVDSKSRAQAVDFVHRFRTQPTAARAVPMEIESRTEYTTLPNYLPPLWQRIKLFLTYAIERPDIFDHDEVRRAIMANAGLLRRAIRGRRERLNRIEYDVAGVDELPKHFIFYPLQFTPEASINTPAPYFVEQLRVIDALRFAMPSDCTLVVKEHPACLAMRPVKFMRHLRSLPGVTVIKVSTPSIEIIKRAALTTTVTGTAAFEAFMLGRPAIAFGPGISAWATGSMATTANLRSEIVSAIASPPSENFVIDQVAKLMSVRLPFFFDTPGLPDEPMLRLHNVQQVLSGLLNHLERERGLQSRSQISIP